MNSHMRNYRLDLYKLIAANCIIAIHCPIIGNRVYLILSSIARYAVPFFFISAGYFACDFAFDQVLKQIKKLFGLTIFIELIYFAWMFLRININQLDMGQYLTKILSWKNWLLLITVNQTQIAGHAWFLLALIYCYIVWLFLRKIIQSTFSYVLISFGLIAVNLFVEILLPCIDINIPIAYIRNWLFVGLPYFIMGIVIKTNYEKVKNQWRLYKQAALILFAIANILVVTQSLTMGSKEIYVGTTLVAAFYFLNAIECDTIHLPILRYDKMSLNIYLFHPIILGVIEWFNIKGVRVMYWQYLFQMH